MKGNNMKLLTKQQYEQLVKNNNEQDGSKDFKVVVKLLIQLVLVLGTYQN